MNSQNPPFIIIQNDSEDIRHNLRNQSFLSLNQQCNHNTLGAYIEYLLDTLLGDSTDENL